MNFLYQKILNKFLYRPILRIRLKKAGSNFRIGYLSEILNPKSFEIGSNFYSGPFGFFGTNKNWPVKIGNNVMFGPRCMIQGGNHDRSYQGFMCDNNSIDHEQGEILIEHGVWIGADTTIISGASIGEGSVIGAKSLVNKKIPPYVVGVGVPVKVIKQRFMTKEQLNNTLIQTCSKYSVEDIIKLHLDYGFYYK
ncbi:acyltransferase [bacterium]|nr:acyltransferase [bacterium]